MSKQRLRDCAIVKYYIEVPQMCTPPEKTFSLFNVSVGAYLMCLFVAYLDLYFHASGI